MNPEPLKFLLLLTVEADAASDHGAGHSAEVIVHVQNIR